MMKPEEIEWLVVEAEVAMSGWKSIEEKKQVLRDLIAKVEATHRVPCPEGCVNGVKYDPEAGEGLCCPGECINGTVPEWYAVMMEYADEFPPDWAGNRQLLRDWARERLRKAEG